ncbi:MAG: EamA family transporter, partial [Promethearchaeota archaeon]
IFVGIAGSLSLGLADTLFYKAAEINGLVLTATFTANTPMVQQILSILILKEKFRKRFIIAVGLIVLGNYIIIFL